MQINFHRFSHWKTFRGTFSSYLPHTTMFSSFSLSVAFLASVHSFTFVAAIAEPQITPAPDIYKRQANPPPILSTFHIPYSSLPEQVYPFTVLRGPQFGYNICNSTTQGNSSDCQTLIVNGPVRLFFLDSDVFNNSLAELGRLLLMGLTYTRWHDWRRGSQGRSLLHPEYPWFSSNSFRCHYRPPGSLLPLVILAT